MDPCRTWGISMQRWPRNRSTYGMPQWIVCHRLVECLPADSVFVCRLGIKFRWMSIGNSAVFGGSLGVRTKRDTAKILIVIHLCSAPGGKRGGMRDETRGVLGYVFLCVSCSSYLLHLIAKRIEGHSTPFMATLSSLINDN